MAGRNTLLLLFLLSIICCQNKPNSYQNELPSFVSSAKNDAKFNSVRKPIDLNAQKAKEIDNKVLTIFQDSNENYWFGTNGGAYRYDGKNLIKITRKDGLFQDQVRNIQEDEMGNIWFSTGGYGVCRLNEQDITTYTIKENEAFYRNNQVNEKPTAKDLWFAAGGGVFRYSKDNFDYLPLLKPDVFSSSTKPPYQTSPYGVYSILKDRKGNIWFGTQSLGVCRYDGVSFTWLTQKGLAGPAVLAIFEDIKGNLWFGNNGNGLFLYDGKILRNITEEKGLGNPNFIKNGISKPGNLARVWSIHESENGQLWIGTGDSGACIYDGTELINYTEKQGLPNVGIETIFKDKKGKIWLGTDGAGIFTFNGTNFDKLKI